MKRFLRRSLTVLILATQAGSPLSSAPFEFSADGRLQVTGGGGGGGGGNDGVPFGTNLSPVTYWSTNLAFTNPIMNGDDWSTASDPNYAPQIPRDAEGYPLEIPYNIPNVGPKTVAILLYRNIPNSYPGGKYLLLYDGEGNLGEGDVNVRFDGRITRYTPGRIEVEVDASQGNGIWIEINSSKRGNHIRNMRFIEAKYESIQSQKFHPVYLASLKRYRVLRFMDWANTNDSEITSWSQRPLPNYFAQGRPQGVAWEHMIDLANELNANPWFCVPYRADDNYIREMANLIKNRLKPNLKVYIEWGNEIWNTGFTAAHWAADQGCAAGYNWMGMEAGDCNDPQFGNGYRFWAAMKYQANRSGKVFQIFEQEMGSRPLVKVLASQAEGPLLNDNLLKLIEDPAFNPTRVQPNALAVAPYFGHQIASVIWSRGEVDTITVDEILDRCIPLIQELGLLYITNGVLVAKDHGVDYITYEGGQHLCANGIQKENPVLVAKLIEANYNSRMRELYRQFFEYWFRHGKLFMHFNDVLYPSQHGSWGAKKDQLLPDTASPKYMAIQDRITQLEQQ